MTGGIVVFDTSCYRFLESDEIQRKVIRDLSMTGWDAWPSAINALEINQSTSPAIRRRLKRTVQSLFPGKNLLPWPHVVVERTGRAIANRESSVPAGDSRFDWLLDDDAAMEATRIDQARTFLARQTRAFEEMHEKGRPEIQKYLKAQRMKGRWENLPTFLDEFWMKPGHINTYFEKLWAHFGLLSSPPIDSLRRAETWTLFLEAQGAAVFERAVLKRMPKRVHLPDLLQLVYLAGAVTSHELDPAILTTLIHPLATSGDY